MLNVKTNRTNAGLLPNDTASTEPPPDSIKETLNVL